MDYLDPKKKQAHKQRLLIGYALTGVLIAMLTVLFVYVANGYFIDRNTGQIIQNGLVFIDARPAPAKITLNGELQRGQTDARLVIPAGQYTIDLAREGYRPWSRTIDLEGGSLRRLTYARLIPNELTSTVSVALPANPVHVSQSIDKKWLLVSYAENIETLTLINVDQTTPTAQELALPAELVTPVTGALYEVVEWADDNATVLVSYGLSGEPKEYVLIDRQNPAAAQNVTKLFAIPNAEIHLQDRKKDRFFLFNPATSLLSTATLTDGVNTTPFIDVPVLAYRTFVSDWAIYVIPSATEGSVDVRLRRGSQDILLKTMKQDSSYILELAKLGSVPVIAIASPTTNPVSVFYDPEKHLAENKDAKVALAATIMRVEGLIDVSISSDASTVMAYGTKKFASYEFEDEIAYSYELGVPVDSAQQARWMDGQHFSFSSEAQQYMVDFDGSNLYDLVPSIPTIGSFYADDVLTMFTFSEAGSAADNTPTTPARLITTRLITAADE